MTDKMRRRGRVKVAEDRKPSAAAPRDDGPTARADDACHEEADVDPGFPSNPIRFALHAVFYCAGKLADKVVSLYGNTFKLDREYVADFNKSTGIAHADRGDWEKAIPLLEKALATTPDDEDIRMHLAEAYGAANQYEKACLHLGKALEASPDSARVVRALGVFHSRRQDYDRAIEYLKRAVALDPDHVQSLYHLGAAYDNKKLYDRAVDSFKEAIRLDPRFAKAYQALGFTYESMGDRESAVGCFKQALQLE